MSFLYFMVNLVNNNKKIYKLRQCSVKNDKILEWNPSFLQSLTTQSPRTPRTPRVVRTPQITRSAGNTLTRSKKPITETETEI
jgi:hypothetical protein